MIHRRGRRKFFWGLHVCMYSYKLVSSTAVKHIGSTRQGSRVGNNTAVTGLRKRAQGTRGRWRDCFPVTRRGRGAGEKERSTCQPSQVKSSQVKAKSRQGLWHCIVFRLSFSSSFNPTTTRDTNTTTSSTSISPTISLLTILFLLPLLLFSLQLRHLFNCSWKLPSPTNSRPSDPTSALCSPASSNSFRFTVTSTDIPYRRKPSTTQRTSENSCSFSAAHTTNTWSTLLEAICQYQFRSPAGPAQQPQRCLGGRPTS